MLKQKKSSKIAIEIEPLKWLVTYVSFMHTENGRPSLPRIPQIISPLSLVMKVEMKMIRRKRQLDPKLLMHLLPKASQVDTPSVNKAKEIKYKKA